MTTKRGRTVAAGADKYALYQQAVQQPEADLAFFERVFRAEYGRAPRVLAEDFCGTALVACRWAASKRDRRAWGIDLDPEPLAWGAQHNQLPLDEDARSRVQLVQADVRTVSIPPADVIVAGNFSFCVFDTREVLIEYFRAVHRRLHREGIFVLDVLGGPETQRERHETKRDELTFEYAWEQISFDPVSYRAEFAIHFRFPDGSALPRAFLYDWRMWTLPELQELLALAGFSRVDVYWEIADPSRKSATTFRRVRRAHAEECWLAEVVAIR